MAKIRHKTGRLGWSHVLVLAFALLGFGLTTAGPAGVAQAARGGHGGGGMRFGGGSRGFHHRGTAFRGMGGRSGRFGFGHHGIGRSRGFGGLHGFARAPRSGAFLNVPRVQGFRGGAERGLRPASPFFIGEQRRLGDLRRQFNGPAGGVRAFNRLERGPTLGQAGHRGIIGIGRRPEAFGREHGEFGGRAAFERGSGLRDRGFRQQRFGAFDRGYDRTLRFGDFDHYRYFDRFDYDDFALFHTYGFYDYCTPTFFPYYSTFGYPDEFVFGPWFGTGCWWWWGHVYPDEGVSVILQF